MSKSHSPYIMPDGRHLSQFLTENNLVHDKQGRKGKNRRKPDNGKSGWVTASVRVVQQPRVLSELEQAELQALERVGNRRRRRWMNDKLLREMAGPMTASDMEGLFKPVPFGDNGHVSVLSQVLSPSRMAVWEHFRSIDPDKQQRVVEKWELHVRQSSPPVVPSSSAAALQRWSGVNRKSRVALKRAGGSLVDQLEAHICVLIQQDDVEEVTLQWDAFQRLLGHGIADYYGLYSVSKDVGGERMLSVSRRAEQQYPPALLLITCADMLWLMEEDSTAPLNTQRLDEYLGLTHTDNSSELDNTAV